MGGDTLGYAVARQAPNGIIHLIATMTSPCLHYELNEAWILHGGAPATDDAALRANNARSIRDLRAYRERSDEGRETLRYEGGIGDDGRFLLHGAFVSLHPNGRPEREATYQLGRLTGLERRLDPAGLVQWTREHRPDGTVSWTHLWPNGAVRSVATWRDGRAEGDARLLDPAGNEVYRVTFEAGLPIRETGHPGEY
jgi:hypothetical protein